ncbi:response regulator [Granulosicoccus sp. 3-233]|uniref:response regulator n=1 Tax=Granulosicoccus sp. 3-233 TaxID=3417969 RepID=UPI003D34EFC1
MSAALAASTGTRRPLNELVMVDDDALTVEIVSWIISKGHFQSRLFTQADEALAYLKTSTPRLLIVDYYMPEMTGLDFISELHDNSDLTQTQVYLCSAVRPPQGSGELFEAMNVDLLEKQHICDRLKLTELLDRHLQVP